MIHAHRQGKGRGRLLLHGINADSHCWDAVLAKCRPGWRCLAVDLPGHGRSAPLPPHHRFEDYADRLAEWLDEQSKNGEPEKWQVVGHSLGGMVAVDLADRHAHRVDSLVLLAPAGIDHPWYHRDLSRIPMQPWLRRLILWLASTRPVGRRLFQGAVFEFESLAAEDIRRLQQSFRRARSVLQLRKFYQYPGFLDALQRWVQTGGTVDLIWGREDRVVPCEDAEKIRERIPTARLFLLERCGHLPMIEQPDELSRILDLLQNSDSAEE